MATSELELEWLSRLPGLDRLWACTRGRADVTVAVLDGPVAPENPAKRRLVPSGAVDHGTLVSSIITGSAGGLAPGCSTTAIPIFEEAVEGGQVVCSQDVLADAIEQALAKGADIINISASQIDGALALSSRLSAALQVAADEDVLIVAAAGNHGCACDTIPSSVPGVLAVGAHDAGGAPLPSSNWGPGQRSEGLLAPGLNIPGRCVGGGLCRGTGTSFAAAVVSGIAALLMSVDLERDRACGGRRTKRILLESCDPCRPELHGLCSVFLGGRLNVSRAAMSVLASTERASEGEGIVTIDALPIADNPTACLSPQSMSVEVAPAQLSGGAAYPTHSPVAGLQPADCGCGCGGKCNGDCKCGGAADAAPAKQTKPQLVYAIGRLGVSFISQARRDSIWRSIHGTPAGTPGDTPRTPNIDLKPLENASLVDLIEREPWQAQSVIWVLSRTEVPMYAILPAGAFAAETYEWLVTEWRDENVEFISLPGIIAGQVTLYDGMTVDAVVPDLRGMFSWQRKRYIGALTERLQGTDNVERQIERFISKIQYRVRNRGLSPEERALNATATNAFNFSDVIVEAGAEGYALKDIAVERSPVNRPGSDYYDVLLTFFDPADRLGKAMFSARFTVDVSDTVPVVIGSPETWYEY